MKKRVCALLLTMVMVLGLFPAQAFAANEPAGGPSTADLPISHNAGFMEEPQGEAVAQMTAATVTLSLEQDNFYPVPPQTAEISAALSDQYGYVDQVTDGVSVLDVLIKAHEILFADAFTKETKGEFLVVNEQGIITTMMSKETNDVGFAVNGMMPNDGVLNNAYGTYTGYTANQAEVTTGDNVQFFFYNPAGYYGEIYTHFLKGEKHVTSLEMVAGIPQVLTVKGYSFMYEGCNQTINWKTVSNAQVCTLELQGKDAGKMTPIYGAITGESGEVTLTFDQPGTYYLGVTSDPENLTYIIPQICTVTVTADPDQEAADTVMDLIKKLPAAEKVTLENKDDVKAAQAAYDALTKEQKALVTNLDKLTAAVAALVPLMQPAELEAYWPNFRGSDFNMAITSARTPMFPEATELKWNKKLGSGWSAAPSPMIIVDDAMVVMVGSNIYKLSLEDGSVLAQGKMVASIGFGIVIPTYGSGMIFCPLSNGRVQAFDAKTLESLWVYQDALKGQPNCPITYADGMIYTGFWNSEVGDANYVAIDVTDENPVKTHEAKEAVWTQTAKGGYYWAGSVVVGDAVIFGTDDGASGTEGSGAHLYALNRKTGDVISDLTGFTGDQRSSIAYSAEKGRVYFTTKGGYLCSAAVDAETGALSDLKSQKLGSNQSTSTPVVYGDQVYLCCGAGVGGGDAANNFTVCDADTLEQLYVVGMKGYPQCSPLLSTAYMETEGKLYFYLTYNNRPGGITLIKVDPTKTTDAGAELVELYDAKGFEQYCICSVICDQNGTLYYKNDSGNILAVGRSENDQQAADQMAANAVIGKIESIGTVTKESEKAITEARTAYDALTAAQKALVTNLKTLTDAEKALEELKKPGGGSGGGSSGGGSVDRTIEVSFRLIGAKQAKKDVDFGAGVTTAVAGAEYQTWIATDTYTLDKGDKVYDLFTQALDEAGLKYHIRENNNYVDCIWAPAVYGGYELREFTNGSRSGWMYTVNGEHPNQGLSQQVLKDGDAVVWHYINDYSYEVGDWSGTDEEYPSLGDKNTWVDFDKIPDVAPGKKPGAGGGTERPDEKVPQPMHFTDVKEGDWCYEGIKYVYEKGMMNGTSDTVFHPNRTITRGQIAAILWRLAGEPAAKQAASFTDVKADAYYAKAVAWAAENGVTTGYADGSFKPDQPINREQLAAFLYRYAKLQGKGFTGAWAFPLRYPDAQQVSEWAYEPLCWTTMKGVINGKADGTLAPKGNATRAQAAVMLMRYCETALK